MSSSRNLWTRMPCFASSAEGWWRNPWMLSSSILRTRKSSSPLAAETSSRGLQQRIKKVEISEPDHCLPSSFALVFRALPHVGFFNYVSKYVRQLLSTVIVLQFIMLAISRSRCYIGPSDLNQDPCNTFFSDFHFSLLNLCPVRHIATS